MEEGLIGLEAGETETLTIRRRPNATASLATRIFRSSETEELREMLGGQTPEEGLTLRPRTAARRGYPRRRGGCRVDFNPRLSGETLTFDVEIIDVNEIEPRGSVEILQA